MATSAPLLIERADIHKSCKSLETVVNLFNDYCHAAETLMVIQKKLSKALKEAVASKATNHLAGENALLVFNLFVDFCLSYQGDAFTAAAFMLESLADVDASFVKAADKECEMASTSLKKWFKKLAVRLIRCLSSFLPACLAVSAEG